MFQKLITKYVNDPFRFIFDFGFLKGEKCVKQYIYNYIYIILFGFFKFTPLTFY